jgi:hypothetical protein
VAAEGGKETEAGTGLRATSSTAFWGTVTSILSAAAFSPFVTLIDSTPVVVPDICFADVFSTGAGGSRVSIAGEVRHVACAPGAATCMVEDRDVGGGAVTPTMDGEGTCAGTTGISFSPGMPTAFGFSVFTFSLDTGAAEVDDFGSALAAALALALFSTTFTADCTSARTGSADAFADFFSSTSEFVGIESVTLLEVVVTATLGEPTTPALPCWDSW